MRLLIVLMSSVALAGCGGMGAETAGSKAVTSNTATTGTSSGSGTGVTGGTQGSGSTGSAGGNAPAHFLDVAAAKTFDAVGVVQSYSRTPKGELYTGDASTVATPSGTIKYNPRDGVFTVDIKSEGTGTAATINFQDPAHRTDPAPIDIPQLDSFNYLEAANAIDGTDTFFYQRPGYATKYVTLGGLGKRPGRADIAKGDYKLDRAVFVFGDKSPITAVPTRGSANYTGGFLASMIANPDTNQLNTYFQWMFGSSTIGIDFNQGTFALALNGKVDLPELGGFPIADVAVPAGSTFDAKASGSIDFTRYGGFGGRFSAAGFTLPDGTKLAIDFTSVNANSSVAGASSIDGTFYGIDASNVGGNFRIIGGIPNQRVDIGGAFTGAKGN